MKDREAVMKELYVLRRESGTAHPFESFVCLTIILSGYESNFEDFKCKLPVSFKCSSVDLVC